MLSPTTCVWLSASADGDGVLTMRATDLFVQWETRVHVTVTEPGSITAPCSTLLAALKVMHGDEVDLSTDDDPDTLLLSPEEGDSRTAIRCLPGDQYKAPHPPDAKEWPSYVIHGGVLHHMISNTIFAVSDDETRYFMNGVLLEVTDGTLRMVATDGRRLSLIERSADTRGGLSAEIANRRFIGLLSKTALDREEVTISAPPSPDKPLVASFGDTKVSSAVIDAKFPDYHRVIPQDQSCSLTVSREAFIHAIRSASVVTGDTKRVFIDISAGKVTVRSSGTIGNAEEGLDSDYVGEPITIAVNYDCLLEPLSALLTESAKVKFTDASKAITIAPPDDEKGNIHVVMPMVNS